MKHILESHDFITFSQHLTNHRQPQAALEKEQEAADNGNTIIYIVGFGVHIYNLLIYILYTYFVGKYTG